MHMGSIIKRNKDIARRKGTLAAAATGGSVALVVLNAPICTEFSAAYWPVVSATRSSDARSLSWSVVRLATCEVVIAANCVVVSELSSSEPSEATCVVVSAAT